MALKPTSDIHKKQIEAGIKGRKKGHKFEKDLTNTINGLECKIFTPSANKTHIFKGNPATQLIQYIANNKNIKINDVKAFWLGGLATSGSGDVLKDGNGNPIKKCKSDVVLELKTNNGVETIGVSVKTCNKKTPTNDQMFFTTAHAFCNLLRVNGIEVSEEAERGLSMFCGNDGFRPLDLLTRQELAKRISDPNRFYWEEISPEALKSWENIFNTYQDKITLLLFQKLYRDDPYAPDYLIHQTVKYQDFNNCETALFSMNEIVNCSKNYSNFRMSTYIIHKGTYKNDNNKHLAPRFGFIQFQRGGQKQHPTQLQFNLKAGYFKLI